MPTCKKCQHQWNWKETMKSSLTFSSSMECPHCEEKQYLTARIRKRSTIIPFVYISVTMLGNLLFGPSYVFFFMLLGFLALFLLIYPFFVELTSKEEYPFQ